MKRKILIGCLLPVALAAGATWWGVRSLMRAEATPARYATVDRGDVEIKVSETGTIEPLTKVEVKSKVAGRVLRLLVQEGDRVRTGQLLVEIDPVDINSQVEQMRAQLDGARAHYVQACRGVTYQKDQTVAGVKQAEEALHTAQARLLQADEENRAQPGLTASDVAQAEANLKAAQDSLTLLKNSTHPQAIVAAQSGCDEAKAAAENAHRNLDRQKRLLAKGFVAEQVVDTAVSDLASANAHRDQAQKKLDLIEEQNRLELANAQSQVNQAQATVDRARANAAQVAIKRQEVLAARAAVDQAKAALNAARASTEQDQMRQDDVAAARAAVVQLENQLRAILVQQSDTNLVATMSGVVTRRYIEQGELVTSGIATFSSGTQVMQVADLSKMLVKISVNEVDVHKVRVGQPVDITIDGAKGALFAGRVRKVAPAAVDNTNGAGASGGSSGGGGSTGVIRFAVEVVVDRPDPRLKPGMSAKCAIIIARRRNVLRLPADCVAGDGAKATVQVVAQTVKDGKSVDTYTSHAVTAGLRGDSHVEIVSGLKAGERVKPGAYTGPPRKGVDMNFD